MVETCAHAVERCRHVLAHRRPVGARAIERNLTGCGKEPRTLAAHDLHHALGDGALQQLDQRVDLARALVLDAGPSPLDQALDLDVDLVDFRATDEGADAPGLDLQVDHRAVAHVRPAARQSIGVVAVGLEVLAPRVAPKSRGDLAARNLDRRDLAPGLLQPGDLLRGLAAALGQELATARDQLSPGLLAMLDEGAATPRERLAEAMATFTHCRVDSAALFAEHDILLTAAAPGEAPMAETTGDPMFNRAWTALHVPCLTLTAGDGPAALPLGVQLVARQGDDSRLITWAQWVEVIQQAPATSLTVLLSRGGRELTVAVVPEAREAADGSIAGYLGVALFTNEVRYGFFAAIPQSLQETTAKTMLTLGLLKKMVTGQVSGKNLSGPIYIAKIAGDSARSGWRIFLGVLALLSISLGVLNLLPIPILDGGHILFCVTEIIIRKPVSDRAQAVATQFGLFIFVGIFLLVIYNDISRLL